ERGAGAEGRPDLGALEGAPRPDEGAAGQHRRGDPEGCSVSGVDRAHMSAGELLDRPGSRDPAHALSADLLCWRCPPLHASGARPSVGTLLGQTRPLQALQTGLELRAPGYHVFVSGLIGTGRTALVKSLLEELRPNGAPGTDRVYLNDFRHP